MNKDINKTLMALVPILRMNGEKIKKIEAVKNWYKVKVDGKEYMKEVAEITYDSGHKIYADIGCDSNLTAIYDVIAVIQQIKPESAVIQRIERNVYETEIETTSHCEQDIYFGCVELMQKLCDEFREYLDYLGYDVCELEEDEKFNYSMTPMQIVRKLFLQHTRHSGGNSTRMKCAELGIDLDDEVVFCWDDAESEE